MSIRKTVTAMSVAALAGAGMTATTAVAKEGVAPAAKPNPAYMQLAACGGKCGAKKPASACGGKCGGKCGAKKPASACGGKCGGKCGAKK